MYWSWCFEEVEPVMWVLCFIWRFARVRIRGFLRGWLHHLSNFLQINRTMLIFIWSLYTGCRWNRHLCNSGFNSLEAIISSGFAFQSDLQALSYIAHYSFYVRSEGKGKTKKMQAETNLRPFYKPFQSYCYRWVPKGHAPCIVATAALYTEHPSTGDSKSEVLWHPYFWCYHFPDPISFFGLFKLPSYCYLPISVLTYRKSSPKPSPLDYHQPESQDVYEYHPHVKQLEWEVLGCTSYRTPFVIYARTFDIQTFSSF